MSHVDGVDDGVGYGVSGTSSKGAGNGVYGESDSFGDGVYGKSSSGAGVNGISQKSGGVLGGSQRRLWCGWHERQQRWSLLQ